MLPANSKYAEHMQSTLHVIKVEGPAEKGPPSHSDVLVNAEKPFCCLLIMLTVVLKPATGRKPRPSCMCDILRPSFGDHCVQPFIRSDDTQ